MTRDERRLARYLDVYTERFGKAPEATPEATPEFVPTRRTA